MKNILFIILAIVSVACNSLRSIKSAFSEASPYERYIESLKKAELLNASMTKAWLSAGNDVFEDSVIVNVPFSESGFFQASTPDARSYRFTVRDGQVLTVDGAVKIHRDAKVFVDLFIQRDAEWERVAFADSTLSLTYEFDRDEECILRLQPELLVNAYYAINISTTPVLINPVFGASNKSIGSFYGASRDNGKRSHEGVDIFARKGTPVIAPTDGIISRVGINTLGGKVVWMRDLRRGHSYYFAHLDSQMVKPGMHVYRGHVLGLVGNTGNARNTPPHLHFGIYQSGSKDPLYYIHKVEQAVESLPIDTGFQQKPFRIDVAKTAMMAGPSEKVRVKISLKKDTYVTVIGQSGEWYRVSLPDHTEGFVLKRRLEPLADGVVSRLDSARVLLSAVHPDAIPVTVLDKDTSVRILARFGDYDFVIADGEKTGWLLNSAIQ